MNVSGILPLCELVALYPLDAKHVELFGLILGIRCALPQ